ncbi:MAG TPA: hypothetical protein VLJ42_06140 [Solirubrobacteraceae bacterium]|nr:hypothetical protein [Solirubrobacteraceae bacterium]
MKRVSIAIFTSFALILALPAGSLATLTEVGQIPATTTPPSTPSCPGSPCLAVSRTTGFQVKVGTTRNLVTVPRNGKIVAWTIVLGKPNAKQIKFFDTNEGGVSTAGIAILRPQKRPNLSYMLVSQSPVMKLEPYFGMTTQFPLDTSLTVKKGDVVALTVPSWAPALALGFPNNTSWRASRSKAQCANTGTQTAHTRTASVIQYYCLYRTARLTYSATLISTP